MRLKSVIERLPWLSLKPCVQTALPFVRVKKGAFCLEWSSVPSVKKSATELKRKQKKKILKCKSTVQVATFNVRTLNRIGQQPEITTSAVEHNIDIVCVQEHRYHHSDVEIKYHYTVTGWMFVSTSAWKKSVISGVERFSVHAPLNYITPPRKYNPE